MSINVDEWGARAAERVEQGTGLGPRLTRQLNRVPIAVRIAVAFVAVGLVPVVSGSGYVIQVGVNALLMAMLAMGLNVVAGWSGLLDLGFIAFYGFGAYGYSLLSSDQVGIHLTSLLAMLIVLIASAALGTLVGLPSIRLVGDYLAILTLFFGQAFIQIVTNVDRGVTGGPGGISDVDPMRIFGIEFSDIRDYYYLLLVFVLLIGLLLMNVNRARIGRAWRALREDPVAAEAMGVPVSRAKLLAFAVGAAIAGLTGTVFAAIEFGAYPSSFNAQFLILVYAVVVLGGTGSLPGVLLASGIIIILPEVLRSPSVSTYLFYILIVVAIVGWVRPWRRAGGMLAGVIAIGLVLHGVLAATTSGVLGSGGALGWLGDVWMVRLAQPKVTADIAFVVLVAAVLLVSQLRPGIQRIAGQACVVYLAAFVWENLFVLQPSVTRQLFLGALLVAIMNLRPQGLLGEARVEVV